MEAFDSPASSPTGVATNPLLQMLLEVEDNTDAQQLLSRPNLEQADVDEFLAGFPRLPALANPAALSKLLSFIETDLSLDAAQEVSSHLCSTSSPRCTIIPAFRLLIASTDEATSFMAARAYINLTIAVAPGGLNLFEPLIMMDVTNKVRSFCGSKLASLLSDGRGKSKTPKKLSKRRRKTDDFSSESSDSEEEEDAQVGDSSSMFDHFFALVSCIADMLKALPFNSHPEVQARIVEVLCPPMCHPLCSVLLSLLRAVNHAR